MGEAPGGLRLWRGIECFVMFALGPAVYALFISAQYQRVLFPALWLFGLTCLTLLVTDKTFRKRQLAMGVGEGVVTTARGALVEVLGVFFILGALIVLAVALWDMTLGDGDMLFSLPYQRPRLWLMIMIGYPLASVYMQEVIWRAAFFHRYQVLFPGRWSMIIASALAFGWVHIVFHNALAVIMTTVGGVMFAYTYDRTRSTLMVSLEHALYGCLVFTVGIGRYFYSGAVGQ